MIPQYRRLIVILSSVLAMVIVVALLIGQDANALLLSDDQQDRELGLALLFYLRMPRVILSLLCGGVLGLAGAALQGFFRNPLVEPSLLGVSSLSAFGAVFAIFTGISALTPYMVPICAILGALSAPLFFLGRRRHGSQNIILIGIGVSSFMGALTMLLLGLMHHPYSMLEALFWMFGSFANRTLEDVACVVPFVIAGGSMFYLQAKKLNILSLGEETATSMGVNVLKLGQYLVLGTALAVGSIISLTGIVGFIGLIAPHIVRRWVGEKPSHLLLPSTITGGILAVSADSIVRLLPTHIELNVGVVTALLGVPVFLHILRGKSHV